MSRTQKISHLPDLRPRPPIIYSRGDRWRYRQYPFWTRTSIPGAGFKRRLLWAEQPLMGSYSLGGLGLTAAQATTTVSTAASLISDPEAYLRNKGPALVSALDRHVVGPLMDLSIRRSAPYAFKYVLPPLAILYIVSGIGAWYAYKAFKRGS